MTTRFAMIAGLAALIGAPAFAQDIANAPPGGDYQKVSDLVELPELVPGLGILYVQPDTLPEGPFLAYDREGRLVSTVYMIPLDQLTNQAEFQGLAAPGGEVDHVDLRYNPGHPGVEQPHYHVILWHVPESEEARVAE